MVLISDMFCTVCLHTNTLLRVSTPPDNYRLFDWIFFCFAVVYICLMKLLAADLSVGSFPQQFIQFWVIYLKNTISVSECLKIMGLAKNSSVYFGECEWKELTAVCAGVYRLIRRDLGPAKWPHDRKSLPRSTVLTPELWCYLNMFLPKQTSHNMFHR